LKRLLIFAMMIASLATTVVGSAASFDVGASDLAAGDAVIAKCDPDGFDHSFTTSNGKVTNVTVTGIDSACVGGQLSVTIANSTGSSIGGGGPVAAGSPSTSVALSPQPNAAAVSVIHIVVVGP
jgi:hypothetical protein